MQRQHLPSLLCAATLLAPVLAGCAAAEDPAAPPITDPTGAGGDQTPTTTTGSVGGMAGTGGEGGGGGGNTGPCGMDCSQFDPPTCFKAVCNEGMYPGPIGECVVVEDPGATCDDGLFCTVGDTCVEGESGIECAGETNDCGLEASTCQQIVCDEDDQQCTEEPVMNGESCSGDNLCITGAVCTNGICGGGDVEDCFLQPVPNDCYVSVCNPTNGQCEPIIGNDGQTCTDLNDLCTVDKVCDNGTCVGGNPKDCSSAAQECEVGVCDMATGNCQGAPGMVGDACSGAVDECNAGSCDMNGMCQPVPLASGTSCPSAVDQCNVGECDGSGTCAAVPVADGTSCDDQQACTTNDACLAGVCTGATTATCSGAAADGCCPSSCQGDDSGMANYDLDCACSVEDILIEEASTGAPDFVSIRNTCNIPLDIDPITICIDEGASTDCEDLPSLTLQPNEVLYLVEANGSLPAPPALAINLVNSQSYIFTDAGSVWLCDGPCTETSAPNAYDAVIWDGTSTSSNVTLPPGINFTPAPVTGRDSVNEAVIRQTTNGTYPNFLQSDWLAGPPSHGS